MAKTYYKYKDRDIEPINFGEIATGVAEAALYKQEEMGIMQEGVKDKESEFKKKLVDVPRGQYELANNQVVAMADEVSELSLKYKKQWDKGDISYSEYIRNMNNLQGSTEAYFTSIETVNKNYDTYLERQSTGVGGDFEAFLFDNFSQLINVTKEEFRYDEQTGIGYLYQKDENGNIIKDKRRPVSSSFGGLTATYDKYDLDAETTKLAKPLAELYKVDTTGNIIKLTTGARIEDEEMKDVFENLTESILANPYNAASILTDYIVKDKNGIEYEYKLLSPDEEGGYTPKDNEIIVVENGKGGYITKLNDKQIEFATEVIMGSIKAKLPKGEKYQGQTSSGRSYSPTNYDRKAGAARRDAMNAMVMIEKLYSGYGGGTDAERENIVNNALQYFNSISEDKLIRKTNGTIEYIGENGAHLNINPNNMPKQDFFRRMLQAMGISDTNVEYALSKNTITDEPAFTTRNEYSVSYSDDKGGDYINFDDIQMSDISEKALKKGETLARKTLNNHIINITNNILSGGAEVKYGGDKVKITIPKGSMSKKAGLSGVTYPESDKTIEVYAPSYFSGYLSGGRAYKRRKDVLDEITDKLRYEYDTFRGITGGNNSYSQKYDNN
jgi:hypothetical protein